MRSRATSAGKNATYADHERRRTKAVDNDAGDQRDKRNDATAPSACSLPACIGVAPKTITTADRAMSVSWSPTFEVTSPPRATENYAATLKPLPSSSCSDASPSELNRRDVIALERGQRAAHGQRAPTGATLRKRVLHPVPRRAVSSVGEHHIDTVGVASSILAPRTMKKARGYRLFLWMREQKKVVARNFLSPENEPFFHP